MGFNGLNYPLTTNKKNVGKYNFMNNENEYLN